MANCSPAYSAADTHSDGPTAELVIHTVPDKTFKRLLGSHDVMIDNTNVPGTISFVLSCSWRFCVK